MTQKMILKGITWDHLRTYGPLKATSEVFEKKYSKVRIKWDVKPFTTLGERSIEELIKEYDLITIDHAYMGQAHENQLLLSLEDRLLAPFLESLTKQSLGPNFSAYSYKNRLYALPIDATALVAASRSDLLSQLQLSLPENRTDLFDFYKKVPKPYVAAWPLSASDLWGTFLGLCAQDSGRDFIQENSFEETLGAQVLDELKQHLEYLHPESINWNSIQVLDQMAASEKVIYAPFLFGDTNYARRNFAENLIHFSNSPSNPKTNISTIMGGVGLAISAQCEEPAWALAYLNYVADPSTQRTIYTQFGGQAASLSAWKDVINNKLCHNFFEDTLATMENVYVRPQHPGWNEFQAQGAVLLHQGLVQDRAASRLMKELNQLYQSTTYVV